MNKGLSSSLIMTAMAATTADSACVAAMMASWKAWRAQLPASQPDTRAAKGGG